MAKPLEMVLGGWQLNGTYSWMAGQPFTPSYRDCNADRDTGWCRPDLIGDYHISDPSQFGWFETTSVPLTANGQIDGPWQRPQRGKFGTVGRNAIVGPSFSQWDMSFFKTFAITERYQDAIPRRIVQLRKSHQPGESKFLRGLPRSRRTHFRRIRQLRSTSMAVRAEVRLLSFQIAICLAYQALCSTG